MILSIFVSWERGRNMRKVSMKTLLFTVLAALFITLIFATGGYCLYNVEANPVLFIVILTIAWAISLWLLLSTVFSSKRKGTITFLEH